MVNPPNDWLVAERAALRRLAIVVAAGTPPAGVFAAVTEEVGRLLGADVTGMEKYEHGTASLVGLWTRTARTASLPQLRMSLGGNNVTSLVFRTRQPARIDDFSTAIRLDPSDPDFYVNRGGARRAKGDYLHAIADLGKAIRLRLSAAN